MKELIRTNDAVLISFIEALLTEAGIGYVVADVNMSVLEGSIGVLPRRVLIEEQSFERARRLLRGADIDLPERPGGASFA